MRHLIRDSLATSPHWPMVKDTPDDLVRLTRRYPFFDLRHALFHDLVRRDWQSDVPSLLRDRFDARDDGPSRKRRVPAWRRFGMCLHDCRGHLLRK